MLPDVSNAASTPCAPACIDRIRSSSKMGPRPQIVSSVFSRCSAKPSKSPLRSGAAAFTPSFTGGGGLGFGPFVPLLVLPATVHAFLRGPRRLKAVSLAWAGYLYLSALVLAWQPDSIGVLTPLFATNGFVVAFSLPPYRLRRRGMRLLQCSLQWQVVSFMSYPGMQAGRF